MVQGRHSGNRLGTPRVRRIPSHALFLGRSVTEVERDGSFIFIAKLWHTSIGVENVKIGTVYIGVISYNYSLDNSIKNEQNSNPVAWEKIYFCLMRGLNYFNSASSGIVLHNVLYKIPCYNKDSYLHKLSNGIKRSWKDRVILQNYKG